MDIVKRFFDFAFGLMKELHMNEGLEHKKYIYEVQNKLINLPNKESRDIYAKMIAREIDVEYFVFLDFHECVESDIFGNVASMFVIDIISSFKDCGIDIIPYLKDQTNGSLIDYDEMKNVPWRPDYRMEATSNARRANEFTLYRKKLAIMAVLEALGVRAGDCGTISLAEAQRFIFFLTGSGSTTDDIRNSPISDLFKASKDNRSDQRKKEDREFVANYFEKLGLVDMAIKIRK